MVNSITNSFIIVILILSSTVGFALDDQEQLKKHERQDLIDQAKKLSPGLAPETQDFQPAQVQPTPAAPANKSNMRVVRKKKPIIAEPETEIVSKIGFSTGVAAWGEQIQLLTADGRQENILVQYTGLSFGLDYTLKGETVGWNTGLKVMLLQGDAQAEGQTITYQNKVDAITPLFAGTGLRFYPHEKVNVTLNVGAVAYKLKLEAPSSVVTSYDFEYADFIQPIGQLQLGWMISENFLFQQEIFAAHNNITSVGWNVSLGYVF